MKKEDLIEEIIRNARRDRLRLEAVADGLLEGAKTFTSPDDEGEINTEIAAAFAEEVSKISDSLSRINHELVEIVKADAKSAKAPLGRLDASSVEEVFDEIQPEEQN